MVNKREYNMDVLRILACFMVVVLHTSAQNWDTVSFTSFEWKAFNFYNAMVRSAVPIFFMISGKLFLSRETLSIKNLFLKNWLKLALVYLLWSVLYAVDRIGLAAMFNDFRFYEFASVVVSSKYHLWYLPELLSVYLMIPVLFALKNRKDETILSYVCLMIFLFIIVRTSILTFVQHELVTVLFRKVSFGWGSCCGYFILGYVLERNQERFQRIKTPMLIGLFTLLGVGTAVGAYLYSAAKGVASAELYNDIFLSNYFEAVVLFLLFLRLPAEKISQPMKKAVQKLSKYTFFVYLIHPFVLEHLPIHTLSFHPWLSVPVIAAVVFTLSMCAAWVIDRIPGVRKIFL